MSTDSPKTLKRPGIMRKLPHRCAALAFAFYMAGIIAFMMSLALTALNSGLGEGYLGRVLKSYMVAMPVAFTCVMLVRPLVVRLVMLTVASPRKE